MSPAIESSPADSCALSIWSTACPCSCNSGHHGYGSRVDPGMRVGVPRERLTFGQTMALCSPLQGATDMSRDERSEQGRGGETSSHMQVMRYSWRVASSTSAANTDGSNAGYGDSPRAGFGPSHALLGRYAVNDHGARDHIVTATAILMACTPSHGSWRDNCHWCGTGCHDADEADQDRSLRAIGERDDGVPFYNHCQEAR